MGLTRTVHRTLGMGPTAPHIPLSMLSSLPHGPTAQPPACAAGPASGLVDPAAHRYDRCPRPRRHPGVYKALAPARPLCSNSNLPSCGQPPPRRSHALRARRLPSSCLSDEHGLHRRIFRALLRQARQGNSTQIRGRKRHLLFVGLSRSISKSACLLRCARTGFGGFNKVSCL